MIFKKWPKVHGFKNNDRTSERQQKIVQQMLKPEGSKTFSWQQSF